MRTVSDMRLRHWLTDTYEPIMEQRENPHVAALVHALADTVQLKTAMFLLAQTVVNLSRANTYLRKMATDLLAIQPTKPDPRDPDHSRTGIFLYNDILVSAEAWTQDPSDPRVHINIHGAEDEEPRLRMAYLAITPIQARKLTEELNNAADQCYELYRIPPPEEYPF